MKTQIQSTLFSEMQEWYLMEIAKAVWGRESDRAQEIGVSLKYLSHSLKSTPYRGSARIALLRLRKNLEQRGFIETYHMDKWQMVGQGKATHVVLTGKGLAFAEIIIKKQTGHSLQEDHDNTVTDSESVTVSAGGSEGGTA
jgi:hypothetical protein